MEKDRPDLAQQLPHHLRDLADELELAAAWQHQVVIRRTEEAMIEELLAYKKRKLEMNENQHTFTQRTVEKSVIRDSAVVLGMTEAAVPRLLQAAEFLQEKLPKTWQTYRDGTIDQTRARKTAEAASDIAHRSDLLVRLDDEAADRALGENAATLSQWLKRRVAELDTQAYQDRYERARARRYVHFDHQGDGMTRIAALIPTLAAAQVEREMWAAAQRSPRKNTHAGARTAAVENGQDDDEQSVDESTLRQRMADVFTTLLQSGGSVRGAGRGGLTVNAKIGVLVPVETLVGTADAPAISWDRSWHLPADEARSLVANPEADHDWYIVGAWGADQGDQDIVSVVHRRAGPGNTADGQTVQDWIADTDPVEENLLLKTSASRYSRGRQRDAITIRDGQCCELGCTKPAWQADIDHKKSFETGGHTAGENLIVRCRDHHDIKGHGLGGADPPGQERAPAWLDDTRPPPEWASA